MRLNDGKILELKLKKRPEKDGILLVAENYDRNIKPSIKFFNQITVITIANVKEKRRKLKLSPNQINYKSKVIPPVENKKKLLKITWQQNYTVKITLLVTLQERWKNKKINQSYKDNQTHSISLKQHSKTWKNC